MRRRSATTRFFVDAFCMLQDTVGVLSKPERGVAMSASGISAMRVALCRTRAASSRSQFVIVPFRFFDEKKSAIIFSGQGCCHTSV